MRKYFMLICLIALLIPAVMVNAETTEKEIFTVAEETPLVISVTWEEGEISCSLISPSGELIGVDTDTEAIKVVGDTNAYYFMLHEPELGVWSIRYDKGSNESITVYGDYLTEPIWITAFDYDLNDTEQEIDVTFYVDGNGKEVDFDYEISLGTSNQQVVKKVLYNGSGRSDKDISKSIDIDDVNSYESYVLYLDIVYTMDGFEYYDSVSSDAFEIINAVNTVEPKSVDIAVNASDYEIKVELMPSDEPVDDYVVLVQESGSTDIEMIEMEGATLTYVSYAPDIAEVTISVKSLDDGQFSEGITSIVPVSESAINKAAIQWQIEEIVSNGVMALPYTISDEIVMTIAVNGIMQDIEMTEGQLTGVLLIQLVEGQNHVEVFTEHTDGYSYVESKTYYYDAIPPQLIMYDDIDGIRTTGETIGVYGNTEQSAVLTIGTLAVELDDDGDFFVEYTLHPGKNEIIVSAVDRAGNISEYAAVVDKQKTETSRGSLGFLPLIIGLGAVAILLVIYWFTGNKDKGGNDEKDS